MSVYEKIRAIFLTGRVNLSLTESPVTETPEIPVTEIDSDLTHGPWTGSCRTLPSVPFTNGRRAKHCLHEAAHRCQCPSCSPHPSPTSTTVKTAHISQTMNINWPKLKKNGKRVFASYNTFFRSYSFPSLANGLVGNGAIGVSVLLSSPRYPAHALFISAYARYTRLGLGKAFLFEK